RRGSGLWRPLGSRRPDHRRSRRGLRARRPRGRPDASPGPRTGGGGDGGSGRLADGGRSPSSTAGAPPSAPPRCRAAGDLRRPRELTVSAASAAGTAGAVGAGDPRSGGFLQRHRRAVIVAVVTLAAAGFAYFVVPQIGGLSAELR